MRRVAIAWSLAVLALVVTQPRAVEAQTLLFDYVGFDYENPNPNPAIFGEVGSGYVGLGEVPVTFSPLSANHSNNDYTYHIGNLSSIQRQVFGDFIVVTYSGPGFIRVYEDDKNTGTTADYGVNPPNATAPSTFIDGTLFLEGELTQFQFVFNTVQNSGSYEAVYEATGGSQLGNIPPNQRKGWTFSGATGNATSIPTGYLHQIDGQVFLDEPTSSQESTWGRIKSTYR